MLDILHRIKAAWEITQHPPEAIDTDSIYPLILETGTITYTAFGTDDPVTVHNTTAIINEDKSVTLTSCGHIIGWIQPGECYTIISE